MKIARKDFELIITVGPSIFKKDIIHRIIRRISPIFRINGAHVLPEHIADTVEYMRRIDRNVKLLVDLPGNKIRTKDVLDPIVLRKKDTFSLLHTQVNFPDFSKFLKKGDIILANDSNLKFEVEDICSGETRFRSHSDGHLENNKGLHISGIHGSIPFLFERDIRLLDIIIEKNIDYVGLSFVRDARDIHTVKDILRSRCSGVCIICKVEKLEAIRNLNEILQLSGSILIDRGDLSSEVGLLRLPHYQEHIIKMAKSKKTNIFLATQVLKNMQAKPVPLISEVIDLYNALRNGIHGIQLSEETAIGSFPEECVFLIADMFEFVRKQPKRI